MSTSINASVDTFQEYVLEASHTQPLLVDFWAEWCSPCLVIAPVLHQVIDDLDGKVGLVKVEVDDGENMKLAGRYNVRGFPTIMLFRDGEEVARFSSARSRQWILQFLREQSVI